MKLVIDLGVLLVVSLIWLTLVSFLRLKRDASFVCLFYFTIFFIYVAKVLDYTIFQFQSLLLLQHLMPELMVRGYTATEGINLIPLVTLTTGDAQTSALNILLMIPFGFGLPFITALRMKWVIILGALFSVAIESLQLLSAVIAGITFRVVDINDVIFNTLGVVIGYIGFILFVRMYRYVSRNWKIASYPVLRYIADRPQI